MWNKQVRTSFFRFVTIHAFDRQTDGWSVWQTDRRMDILLTAKTVLHGLHRCGTVMKHMAPSHKITSCYNKNFSTVRLSRRHAKDGLLVIRGIKVVVAITICIRNDYIITTPMTKRNTEVTSKYLRKLHWVLRRHITVRNFDTW